MIDKTQSVIQRMRWRAHFFLQQSNSDNLPRRRQIYGLKSRNGPPSVADLKPFEDDVAKMIKSINFTQKTNDFLQSMERDKVKVRASTNVFVPADKTRNIYKMNPAAYSKLLTENVTNIYKHAEEGTVNAINDELMQLASKLDISGRVDRTSENPAFITLKDHKPNFENHPKCRLINPSKSSLGKVSKVILDRINNDIRDQVHVNQWRNSTDVISWFINIKDKSRKSFISFDIVDFYPSISESLLDQAIEWAKQHLEITSTPRRHSLEETKF